MGKSKKERRDSEAPEEEEESQSWEEKTKYLCPIAKPLASKKLTKRIHKTVKKANKIKNQVYKGVREVQKAIRKNQKGLVVIAGDVSPIDVISHIPVFCESHDIPYCYVPSKEDLGGALGSKRQTCMVMLKSHEDYMDYYTDCESGIKELPKPY
ncbi:H/ACA ribonucleoprotein complex subunit 2-like protein [Babylonia areolata]|uniref:H/ACA ribonucleoprotein complex subunit 2-like protein n=1 Tax=Babylonia areolata TaxID=304850 RepID=UPI003FD3C94A